MLFLKRYVPLLCVSISLIVPSTIFAEDIRIALRANKGAEKGLKKWQATADYLSIKIPGYRFIMVPFENNSALNQAVSLGEFHFCLTNPASAVEHEIHSGSQPLATLINKRQGKGYTQFGSVIFTRKDREDINKLKDLKGKVFLGVDELGFGGWRVAWRELLKNNINPYRDFKEIKFAGGKQQRVVYAVRDGKVDAGSVRTDMLERMSAEGKINLDEFKVIGEKETQGFPFLHSTPLYPEWLFSTSRKVDDKFKTQVIAALFSISSDSRAAMDGKYVGWISPPDYTPVKNLLKELAIGPYSLAEVGKFKWLIDQYWQYIIVSLLIISLLFWLFLYFIKQNKRIIQTQDLLLTESESRETLELELVHAQKIESLGQLTGGIAHDFNNMLASILGFTELALLTESAKKDDNLVRYLNQIMASGESAKLLVSQMLAFSRSRGKLEKAEVVLVDQLIDEIYELLHPLLPSSIELKIKKNQSNLFVNVNRVMIEQVLMNICINSKDAFDNNKGLISISMEAVSLDDTLCSSCHQNISGSYAVIEIEDNGSGISDDVKERIFDPFYSTKEVGKGTGMGLAMVHGIIHKHNGHIQIDSTLGKGTSFKLLLPLESKQEGMRKNEHDSSNLTTSENTDTKLKNKHILIVDDEVYITNYLQDLLKMNNYDVTLYNDSEEAFTYFENNYKDVDLVITDQTMPNLTGVELVSKIFEITHETPIILCTGYSETIDKEKALKMEIDAFLEKPIQSKELLSTISLLLLQAKFH